MGLDIITYAKSKKYTDETVLGGGAIKGKNLVVTSIETITNGVRINVQWTLDDGTVLTDYVDLFDGKDGKGIKSVAINSEEHLIITYDDDTTTDAGKIEIQSAVDSVNGETGDVVLVLTDIVNVGSNLTYNSTTKTLSADAQAQVQADWEQSDNTQADYIKNKPSLGTASEKDAINAVLAGSPSLPTGGAVKTAIDEAVSGAYHHAGTKTVAELTSALLVEANDGNVYNMTDSGVTTADFIEGAGKPIAIGGNVGVAKVGNDYKFDLLSGFVDTSNFVNKSSTSGLIKNDGTIDTTDYADKSEMSITDGTGADLGTSTIQLKSGTSKKVLTEHQDVTGKADKVQNATNNHIALLDSLGNLKDGGKAITDLIPNGGTTGQVLAKHSNTDGDVEWKDVGGGSANIQEVSYATFEQKSQAEKDNGTVWFIPDVPVMPNGRTATPNDVQTWLACANITDKAYTTVSQVLADTTTLTSLINDNNASDYMARSTTWATTICANQTAMTLIGANNYCADAVLANSTWLEAVANSTYFESVLNVKVPVMTSNTTPSGEVLHSRMYGDDSASAYRVFDNDLTTLAGLDAFNNVSDNYFGYDFTTSKVVKCVKVTQLIEGNKCYFYSWKFEGSNDASTWTQLDEVTANTSGVIIRTFTNATAFRYYRCHLIRTNIASRDYYGNAKELQFYGREDV